MSYPVCLVDIYGREEQWTLQADVSPGKPFGESPASDLLSCQTEKHLHYAQPTGHFSLTLAHRVDSRGRSWADRLRPQDLVVIQMQNFGQRPGPHGQGELHTVMIGLIDSIRVAAGTSETGTPVRQIVVTGSDFGKLFQRGNVTYWSFLGAATVGASEFIMPHYLNGQPHMVMTHLIKELFFKFMRPSWVFRNTTVNFEDVLGYALTSYQSEFPGGLDWQFIQSEAAFWSFFIKVASPPFHEIYLDTRRVSSFMNKGDSHPLARAERANKEIPLASDGTPLLQAFRGDIPSDSAIRLPLITYGADNSAPFVILRPPPFPDVAPGGITVNLAPWNSLPTHVIDRDEIGFEAQQQDLSRSDTEIFNLYLIHPRGSIIGETQYLLNVPPLLDRRRFHQYGYRPLMVQTTLLQYPNNENGNDPWLVFYQDLLWKLAGWNVLNDYYWSGTMSYPLMPHVHIGERLIDRSTWMTASGAQPSARSFYIESIRHEFYAHQRASTKIGVTRGLREAEDQVYASMLQGVAGELTDIGFDVRQQYLDLIHRGQEVPS